MKASRRKFFGLMGGAAVAGPAAAKSVVEPLVSAGIPVPSSGYYGGVSASVKDGTNTATRIADLVKRLSGFRTHEEIEQERIDRLDNAANMFRYEVDALRSVSARHKLSMIRAKHEAVNKARQRHWWETDLNRLREGKAE